MTDAHLLDRRPAREMITIPMLRDGKVVYKSVGAERWRALCDTVRRGRLAELRRRRFGVKLGLAGFAVFLAIFISAFL